MKSIFTDKNFLVGNMVAFIWFMIGFLFYGVPHEVRAIIFRYDVLMFSLALIFQVVLFICICKHSAPGK